MEQRGIQRLSGCQDILAEDVALRESVGAGFRSLLTLHGYRPVETPVLERAELYLRKSGGEMAARLLAMSDPGGERISPRPEFTASVIRAYVEREADLPLPVRWQYAGPVFRAYPAEGGPVTQFTQIGAELIGSASPQADAEVMGVACRGLAEAGLREHHPVIGHVGVLSDILEAMGLSDRASMFLLSSIGRLREGDAGVSAVKERATEVGLLGHRAGESALEELARGMSDDELRALLHSMVQGTRPEALGSRTPDEIASRFLAKLRRADDPRRVEQAVDTLAHLCRIQGEPEQAFREAARYIQGRGLDPAPVARFQALMDFMQKADVPTRGMTVDFGLARGIAYYTGLVFELQHDSPAGMVRLGGGGRYDGLIRALGGRGDVPAMGFAYSVERVVEALCAEGRTTSAVVSAERILVVPEADAYPQAQTYASELRRRGVVAEMEVSGRTAEDALVYARRAGMTGVVVVDAHGKAREMRTKEGRHAAPRSS
ncbi:MAG: histidine--tRNA ligase family protein [Gemmatimonadetes bacterium]|nr:histidine--tRNA ligase family protein [Gemmatimonadota bacterium]